MKSLNDLLKKLDQFPGRARQIAQKIVRVWALHVEHGMMSSAPVKTGALKSMIGRKVVEKAGRFTAIVGAKKGDVQIKSGAVVTRSTFAGNRKVTRIPIRQSKKNKVKVKTPTRYARKVAERTTWYQSIKSSMEQANQAAMDVLNKELKS